MSEQAHTPTPGPWHIEPGHTIISIQSTAGNNSYRIAAVGGMHYWENFTEIDAANARLIAAAPDLLAALKGVTELYDDLYWCGTESNASIIAARAAIALAEGRSPSPREDQR